MPWCWKARSPALGANMSWACARGTATRETLSIRSRAQVARREDVLNALSQIARKLRTRVGESQATVEKHSTPLAEATTPSLEALKAYSTATEGDRILRGLSPRPYLSSGAPSRSIPNSPWRTPVWDLRTALLESRCCRLRARREPGNCAIVSAIESGSSSTSPTTGRSREIWKRRTKPSNCGFRHILAGRNPLP